jgi:membrane protease YdiL (CAAX protease family)
VAAIKEIPAPAAMGTAALAAGLLALAFRGPLGPWNGMTLAMGILLAVSLFFRAVRRRLAPTPRRLGIGLAAAAVLFGLTRAAVWALPKLWPAWEGDARQLSAWKLGHSTPFLAVTLVLIVVGEEALWRGVVARFAIERLGRTPGVLAGAAIYAAAHAVTLNPLLVAAAFGCGLCWGLLYAADDDLTAPIVSHLAWDAMILFVVPVI